MSLDPKPHAARPLSRLDRAILALACALLAWLLPGGRPASADPAPGRQVHLPVLGYLGQDTLCRTWIEAQNLGDLPTKVTIVVWAAPGFCPPQAAGPLKVECSGLLGPGSTWNFQGGQIPVGARSAIAFSFLARQFSEVGIDPGGFDDVIADYMCERLFFDVVGDHDAYRRFKQAYDEGGLYERIPLDRVTGSPLGIEVLRHCPADLNPAAEVSAKYEGISEQSLGIADPVFGGFSYYAPLLYAGRGDFDSVIYIQNAGIQCSSVEIWFKQQDDCLRARICEVFTLAPGETFQYEAADCVGLDWQGSAWVRASQPMAMAVDIYGRDVLMSYTSQPAEIRYAYAGLPTYRAGSQVAYGPLTYSEYQGWDSGIQVMNLSPVTNAKVKVYFLDRGGDVITTLVDWVCARGSQTFYLPVVAGLPGTWVGAVRVESQDIWNPGNDPIPAPDIQAVAALIRYTDPSRAETAEAIAYNLLPEVQSFDWQIGPDPACCRCPGPGCVGLIGVPSLLKDRSGSGITTEIAVQNLVVRPGFTDYALYIYDQNGLLAFDCSKLGQQQVEYINLANWGFVPPGFKGSAVISATYWEHFSGRPGSQNVLGLAAVVVERTGGVLGEAVPGDEAAGGAGFPIFDRGFGFADASLRPRC
ncbi:MAG: hypothetical protein KDH92_15265, partial [Chloroflexi bacterium]|nr:hypothetical protein [Chloroflexota bacterium]